jgi:hypothetical protein
MPPTIISKKASSWVDRGEPAVPRMCQLLAFLFGRRDVGDAPWLEEHAQIILGMVAADSTDVHIRGYLRSLEREGASMTGDARVYAIALWHVGKAALVRDFAERVLRGEIPVNAPTKDRFSHWIASKLLSPEELARFEAQAADEDDDTDRAPEQPG